ncbi:YciI family protein [Asanoa sp. WMMD1127]|uniref:YciI family protein n=1 Tax=Asanoa sp. WMMD1127 TaxID=3016107 RepID=UPI002416EE3B|nr:YciI family protein [Asanoa sp. WMMD1127]MDG4822886.1 YciI family protein [Asanoa sp. WMMD1127]
MFLLELAFDDNPERLRHRPAHRELLADLKKRGLVAMAGPYADESGALLIFDVATEAEFEELVAADPYYRAPGVTIAAKREWNPVVS